MNSTIILALALVLVLEGLGPMLFPRIWRRLVLEWLNYPIPYCGASAEVLWLRAWSSTTC